jgi:hypothetical protein
MTKIRFCLDKNLNTEYQLNLLKIISSFLGEHREDQFAKRNSFIEFTLTKRRHLGKILIHRFKESKLTKSKQYSVKKLSIDDWTREFEAHFYYGVIRPLDIVVKLINNKEKKQIIEKMRKHFLSLTTTNYTLI